MNYYITMKAELLMPAGNLSKLKTAIHFGADAVYLGGKDFSLRAFADNFTRDEIIEGINFAHERGKKVYVTANIFAKNSDFDKARNYFEFLEEAGADAVLITDPGLICLCKECAPKLTIHLSTQANTTNKYTVKFWAQNGIKRIVLARELSLSEINEIHQYVPEIELEAFVHGAMCMSYSGRCLLSSYFSHRSANRGACIQPCRWEYQITELEKHSQKPLNVQEDEHGTYFMNSKDLRLLSHIPELLSNGIYSLKVEGRMKSEFYVATVALCYRKALDEYFNTGKINSTEILNKQLETVAHRAYTDCYFEGDNLETISHDHGQVPESYSFTALVLEYRDGWATVEMRNRFYKGQTLDILSPNDNCFKEFIVDEIYDQEGTSIDDAKLVQHHYRMNIPFEVQVGDIFRRKILK